MEVDGRDRAGWEELGDAFADASLFQSHAYGALRWGAANLSHLVLSCQGRPVAAAQVRLVRLPVAGAGAAYVSWGPLHRPRAGGAPAETLERAVAALVQEYSQRRGLVLRLVPRLEDDPAGRARELLTRHGLAPLEEERPYHTYVLDLGLAESELRDSLHGKWRSRLKKTLEAPLELAWGQEAGLYQEFAALFQEMSQRKGFEDLSDVPLLGRVQEDLPPRHKMLLAVARHEGRAVAAVAATTQGDTAVYYLGASSPEGRDLGASYLLQWQMLLRLRERGFAAYDLGGVNPAGNPGVHEFKQRLAGKRGREVRFVGQWQGGGGTLSRWAASGGEKIRRALRKRPGG